MAAETIQADSANVILDTPLPGETTVNFSTLTYTPGTSDLFVFHNGLALVVDIDYIEVDSDTIVLSFIPDAIGPDIDVFSIHTIEQGSSILIPSPVTFNQIDIPKRPNNFGGRFVYP